MKIKAFVAVVVVLSISANSNAQRARVEGGLNLANVTVTDDGQVDDAKMLTSFQVGIRGDFPVGDAFSIQPGLFYTGKGTKFQKGDPSQPTYYKATSNPFYIEMPVNFVFKTPSIQKTRFFAGAGPYLAIGVSGRNKVEGKYMGVAFSSEYDIEYSDERPMIVDIINEKEYANSAAFRVMRRFDYGLNGTAGIEGKSLTLSANYGLGFAKLQPGPYTPDNKNNKHRVLSFTLGFKL